MIGLFFIFISICLHFSSYNDINYLYNYNLSSSLWPIRYKTIILA